MEKTYIMSCLSDETNLWHWHLAVFFFKSSVLCCLQYSIKIGQLHIENRVVIRLNMPKLLNNGRISNLIDQPNSFVSKIQYTFLISYTVAPS